MILPGHVMAVARAEWRLTRRLVRYWVFLSASYLIGLLAYLYYCFLHGYLSSYSATVASISPRYLMGALGIYSVLIFMVGIVFLGFDVRARDVRERMVEVLDSRPFTNLELLSGRFVAIMLAGWVPVAILMLLLEGLGLLLPALGAPIGEPIEPVSLVTFIFPMMIPAFAFSLALTFLVTLVVRNRLVAAVVVIAILGGLIWGAVGLPLNLSPLFDITGTYVVNNFASAIMPQIVDGIGLLQRIGVVLAALALLWLAAALHPRLDGGSRPAGIAGGLATLAVAVGLMSVAVSERSGNLDQLKAWRLAHTARAGEPAPDIVSLSGDVTVEPGSALAMELELTLQVPDTPRHSALFTLNPGLEVQEVRLQGGGQGVGELSFSHENGLLDVELPQTLRGGDQATLELTISGRPDNRFAYLDAPRVPEALTGWDGQIFILGFERAIFDHRFVALMPGIRWLPASGAEVQREDTRLRSRDFYTVDLAVTLPEGWLAAGPGKRHTETGGGTTRFRFSPLAPVPEVCLVASRFASRAIEIDGVWLEVLVHPSHTGNLEVLAQAQEEVRTWIAERLETAREAGLAYPYDGFSLVEVPITLRGFAGGWRLDTAMAPPAMMLVRESSFPTARFDVPFRDPDDFADREGGVPRAMRERLQRFFLNDFSGGNLLMGAARSFFIHQSAAAGPESLPLNFVLEDLATHLVTDSRGYFSAHLFTSKIGQMVQRVVQSMLISGRRDGNAAAAAIDAFTSRPEIWNAVLTGSLVDLEPYEDPQQTLDALTLKGGALAQALYDTSGAEGIGQLLAALRQRYSGEVFTLDDVVAASATVDAELGRLLADWITTTQLPGFVGESAEAYRLPDADDGTARYQLLARVRNDEPVPGFFRLEYRIGTEDDQERLESDPIRLGGNSTLRWATVVSRPPLGVWVAPYVSLNRETFRIPLQTPLDQERIVDADPLEGLQEEPWQPPPPQYVVDDLDEGFAVSEGKTGGMRLGVRRDAEADIDQGLPVKNFGRPPARWSRAISATAWGKYRHTFAHVKPGKGKKLAMFTTTLPDAGAWQLEIHLPHKQRFRRLEDWGTWRLQVREGVGLTSSSILADFDATSAPRGWNHVGEFSLSGGEVTVELSDEIEGEIVIADAIRWTPAGNGAATTEMAGDEHLEP